MHTGRWHGRQGITAATENIYYLLTEQVKLTRLYIGNKFTAYAETLLRIEGLTNAALSLREFGQYRRCAVKSVKLITSVTVCPMKALWS